MTAASDLDLLSQWSAGSRAAGTALLERHFALVYRFFSTKVGSESADLVQQTFLACIEARERFRGHASFKTFLLSIARNQLFVFYREKKRGALDVTVTSLRDLKTSPSGQLARHQHERMLIEALTQLPIESQMILELVYWQGLSGAELAAVLEVPLNTAASKLRRARLSLGEVLERETGNPGFAEVLLRGVESGEVAPP